MITIHKSRRLLLVGISMASMFVCSSVSLLAAISISSPANGAALSSPVQLSATISGSRAESILVYDNSSLILQKNNVTSITAALTLTAGTHTIMVQATGGHNGTASATSTITVSTPVTPPAGGTSTNVGAEIAADMTGLNEGNPQGVPLSWDFAVGPVMGLGNTPPSGWTASTAWGVVYQGAAGNTSTNTRVNIRNVQLYFLSKSTGQWSLLQNTSQPDGAAYKENFSGDTDIKADVRTEPDGTISVTSGMGAWAGDNYHFYPAVRGTINPNDVGGVVSIFEARLILGNASLPDDRSTSNYLAEAGADYWPSVNGNLPASYNGVTPPVGNGKFKKVEIPWRFYTMTTMTSAQLQSNPPPIDLTGINP
jgi:hypothetical protein